MIDKNLIPMASRSMIECYLAPSMPSADYDYLVLMAFYGFSKIACCNRVILENQNMSIYNTYPNIYTLAFSESGSGKDLGMRVLKRVMGGFHESAERKFKSYFDLRTEQVEKEVEEKDLKSAAAKEYRAAHGPRTLKIEIDSNATVEGFLFSRLELERAEYGCSSWEDSEIYDTIKSAQTRQGAKDFLKYNKEAFDHGFTRGKVIKGEKTSYDVKSVPHCVALHGAIDNEEDANIFKNFFDLGWARRSFVYIAPDDGFKEMTVDEMLASAEEANHYLSSCEQEIIEFDIKTRMKDQIVFPRGCKKVLYAPEVEKAYFQYKIDCSRRAYKLKDSNNRGVVTEINGRHWKSIKLAALICLQETRPNEAGEFFVTLEHFTNATKITDYYGDFFARFYLLEADSIEKKVADYIISHPNISRSDLTKAKILGNGTYNQKSMTVKNLIDGGGLDNYLACENKVLFEEKIGAKKNGSAFTITEIPDHKEQDSEIVVNYSQGLSNNRNETTMLPKSCKFSDFHKIVSSDKIYSAARFKDDYRKAANWISGDDLIILDIDNDVPKDKQLTIQMAKERLIEFTHLIMPTKSHLKEKAMSYTGEKKENRPKESRERFRIIIPTIPMEGVDREKYGDILKRLVKDFKLALDSGGWEWVDLPALGDPARMYFGNESEPQYNFGKLLNWKVYQFLLVGEARSEFDGGFKNQFNTDHILTINNKPMAFKEYLAEALIKNGDTVPCHAHCHADKNASAFIAINQHGNFQYTCTACGISEFYKI